MKIEIIMQHVALHYNNRKKADIFFKKILGLSQIKTFIVSKQLSKQIFNLSEDVEVVVYGNDNASFEIFITEKTLDHVFDHVCIKVSDKEEFITRCEKHGLKPYFVNKGEKKLLFVRDFSSNLYEIK